jgi:hypothetical protein
VQGAAAAAEVQAGNHKAVILDLYNKVVSVRDDTSATGFKPSFYFVQEYRDEDAVVVLAELEEVGTFPQLHELQPAVSVRNAGVVKRAGKKRWKAIPQERGGEDIEIHQDQVAIVSSTTVKKVPDIDEEEWHIPMSNTGVLP